MHLKVQKRKKKWCEHIPFIIYTSVNSVLLLACADGWHLYNGHCYAFSTNSVKWLQAREACETYPNTDLVVIDDEEEQNYLKSVIEGDSGIF